MKTESSESIRKADDLLASAAEHAKRAVETARKEANTALVASKAQCDTLEGKIRDLEDAMNQKQADLDSAHGETANKDREIRGLTENLASARTQHSAELATRDATIAQWEKDYASINAKLRDMRVMFLACKVACARAEWLVSGVGVDFSGITRPRPAFRLASHFVGLASHSASLPSAKYRGYHLSHNFEIRGLLVIAVRNDEDNSLPTCKPAGFWDLNDITGFLESIYIENDSRSGRHVKIFAKCPSEDIQVLWSIIKPGMHPGIVLFHY
ncbi:hypothetical protein B0H14DRAFT_2616526 [Mycena olivaceomarginata]|nr:hypothetical protein B0H14DRAFT_2616526 [Mycena olivaceomarginata]